MERRSGTRRNMFSAAWQATNFKELRRKWTERNDWKIFYLVDYFSHSLCFVSNGLHYIQSSVAHPCWPVLWGLTLPKLITMILKWRWCIVVALSTSRSSLTLTGSLGFVTGRKQTLPLRKHASLLGHSRAAGGTRRRPLMTVSGGLARLYARKANWAISLVTCVSDPWRFELARGWFSDLGSLLKPSQCETTSRLQ